MPGLDSAASGEAASPSPVRISEVMTSNASAYKNDLGAYDDWVEFVNTGTEDVRLNGYTLRRADDLMALFTFPDVTLAPGEYILVYCDGVDRNTAGYALHAAFRLSADGVTLQLRDASGALADSVDVPRAEPQPRLSARRRRRLGKQRLLYARPGQYAGKTTSASTRKPWKARWLFPKSCPPTAPICPTRTGPATTILNCTTPLPRR